MKILNWLFPSRIKPLPRTDPVLLGFYGSDADQPKEVAGFTDIHWESMMRGEPQGFENIRTAAKRTVVDLTACLYDGVPKNHTLAPDAEARLRAFRARLEAADLMQYIWAVYPIDEPDLHVPNRPDIHAANMIARLVFPECKLILAYADIAKMYYHEDGDILGFDDYTQGAGIFDVTLFPCPPMSDYDRLASILSPNQRIALFSGGADRWRQDPTPFYKKAAEDGRVLMVVAYLWIDVDEGGKTLLGIRNNGMAKAYGKP